MENDLCKCKIRFRAQPIGIINGIPIFSQTDKYVENYKLIASDHLEALAQTGSSPFNGSDVLSELDVSTISVIKKYIKSGDLIFDAGVGLGGLLEAFPEHLRYGADIDLKYLERARENGVHVIASKIEDLPYESDSFDVVTCTDVLEHVIDLHMCISQLHRVLRPGGTFVMRVPFEEDLKAYFNYKKYDFVHLRRFDLYGVRILMEKVYGFEYLEHLFSNSVYRGHSTCYINFLEDSKPVQKILKNLPLEFSGREKLINVTSMDQYEFEELMNHIALADPNVFRQLVKLVAKPLEVVFAFRKPLE